MFLAALTWSAVYERLAWVISRLICPATGKIFIAASKELTLVGYYLKRLIIVEWGWL